MLQKEVLISCRKCKKRFPMNELKYDKNGEDLVCSECFDMGRTPQETASNMKNVSPSRLVRTGPRNFSEQTSIKYICMDCQYKFTRRKDYEVFKCPYCEGMNLKKEKGIHSQQLIDTCDRIFD